MLVFSSQQNSVSSKV
jgi:hypothetical protein